MQFNVAHLLKGSVGTTQVYTLDTPIATLEETKTDRVCGRIQLMHVNDGVWVSGLLDANAVCSCSRCLQDFHLTLRCQLDEVYSQVVDVATGAPLPISPDADSDFTIDDHHILDITEAVRQSVIVAIPMKPLCQPSCAGLCPECGANRNQASCACQSSRIDTRWTPILRAPVLRHAFRR